MFGFGFSLTKLLFQKVRSLGERIALSGKQFLAGGSPFFPLGINQGNWGENYQPDAAIINSYGSKVVRILIRVDGPYDTGTDSASDDPAQDYFDPVNYAKFMQELDWLEAQGLWIIIALDSDYAAGNRGLGTADWNLFDTTDTANQAIYKARWHARWRRIVRDNYTRKRVLAYEVMPEPMPTGSNAGHGATLKAFYAECFDNIRTIDSVTPFLIGGRGSYSVNTVSEVLFPERTDVIYTIDALTNKVEAEDTIAATIELCRDFMVTNNTPLLIQQLGRNTSEDEGNGTTSDNPGLTAMNGAMSVCIALGVPFTWWQFHQNSINPGAYALWFKTDANQNNANNWTPKQGEIDAYTFHMTLSLVGVDSAAEAAATASSSQLFYIKSDLSNVWQDSAGTVPVTAVGDPVGKWSAVVGARVFTQATAGLRPTLVATANGYALNFVGASNMTLQLDQNYFTATGNALVGIACRPNVGNSIRTLWHTGTSATTVRTPYLSVSATDTFLFSNRGDNNVAQDINSVTLCDNRAVMLTGERIGANKKGFVQGVQESTTNTTAIGSIASITRSRLGASSSGTNGFDGVIATVFLNNGTWTDAQRRAMARQGAFRIGAPFRAVIN